MDKLSTLNIVCLIISTVIKSKLKKVATPLYGRGKYKNASITFYKQGKLCQFLIQEYNNYYKIYLLKNETLVRKEILKKSDTVKFALKKILYFFEKI